MTDGATDERSTLTSDVVLDNRSTPCAVGLIRAAESVRALAPGQVLEILSRDRFAPMEVPLWAERDGHQVQSTEELGRWPRKYYRFRIRARGQETDTQA